MFKIAWRIKLIKELSNAYVVNRWKQAKNSMARSYLFS